MQLPPETYNSAGILIPVPATFVAVQVYMPLSAKSADDIVRDGNVELLPLNLMPSAVICSVEPEVFLSHTTASTSGKEVTVHSSVILPPAITMYSFFLMATSGMSVK